MQIELQYNKENAEASLAAAVIAFTGALRSTLEELAKAKGTADLSWFDQLHENAIRSMKGTITEEIAIEAEADAIGFALKALDASFQTVRASLVEKQ